MGYKHIHYNEIIKEAKWLVVNSGPCNILDQVEKIIVECDYEDDDWRQGNREQISAEAKVQARRVLKFLGVQYEGRSYGQGFDRMG